MKQRDRGGKQEFKKESLRGRQSHRKFWVGEKKRDGPVKIIKGKLGREGFLFQHTKHALQQKDSVQPQMILILVQRILWNSEETESSKCI